MSTRSAGLVGKREYVLSPYGKDDLALVEAYWVCRRRDDTIESVERIAVTDEEGLDTGLDRQLAECALVQGNVECLRLDAPQGVNVLNQLLRAGRLSLHNVDGLALSPGEPRAVKFDWRVLSGAEPYYQLQWLAADPEQAFQRLLAFSSPYYLDLPHGQIGPLDTGVSDEVLGGLELYEPLDMTAAENLRAVLEQMGGYAPPSLSEASSDHFTMVPRLTLGSRRERVYQPRSGRMVIRHRHRAALAFNYGGSLIFGESPHTLMVKQEGKSWQVSRDVKAEQRAEQVLLSLGFRPAKRRSEALSEASGEAFEMGVENGWLIFSRDGLSQLRKAGWEVIMQPDFAFNITPIESWYLDVSGVNFSGNVSFGVWVAGKRMDLRGALSRAIARSPARFTSQALSAGGEDGALVLELPAELEHPPVRLALPHARLLKLLNVFYELRLDPNAYTEGEPLRWSALELHRLLPLIGDDYEWPEDLSPDEIQRRYKAQQHTEKAHIPQTLNATLRSYQQQGLAWLQRIQQVGAGGLLADDMGLGKTVQIIAFLLGEYESGRLDHPALVIVPTSLLANWEDEFERFAPTLSVLTLHGNGRHQRYSDVVEHHVVLTSYPVLVRDEEALSDYVFHALVCDEAQVLKNPASRTATVVRRLRAGMRVCLSGTPVENHLGELWSQFDVLIPGLLGRSDEFSRRFRQPIEGNGDRVRLELLLTRLKPYLLRRTKEEVASDLPSKNEIVVRVELQGHQRQRYEDVRQEMLSRIESAARKEGYSAIRMLVLEALLRLRQISCDARLFVPHGDENETDKGKTGAKYASEREHRDDDSAKLDALLEMLEPMLEAGRRVLIFSQFTSVLSLIQQALNERGWGYLLLTGETTDRREPVRAFQALESQLMLISLKVGGTGLNLTAADTVVLFDPWWNPAVENQAIDRAHRIGQDKSVFVYRLIARGTVEERIRVIQRRKAALSNTLLEGESGLDWSLDSATLKELFAPLE